MYCIASVEMITVTSHEYHAVSNQQQLFVQHDSEKNIKALDYLICRWLPRGFPSQRARNMDITCMSWHHDAFVD